MTETSRATPNGQKRVRWLIRIGVTILVLLAPLLLAGRRPASVATCTGSTLRGRQVGLGLSANLHGFPLADSATQSIAASAIDPVLQGGGEGRYLDLRLDSSSRFYVFDADLATSSGLSQPTGRPCATAEYDASRVALFIPSDSGGKRWLSATEFQSMCLSSPSARPSAECGDFCNCAHAPGEVCTCSVGPPIACLDAFVATGTYPAAVDIPTSANWAYAPYTQADDGPRETVSLSTFGPVHSMRNYDVGACDATLGWAGLSASVNRALYPQVVTAIRSNPHFTTMHWAQSFTMAGALLEGSGVRYGPNDDRFVLDLHQRAWFTGGGLFGVPFDSRPDGHELVRGGLVVASVDGEPGELAGARRVRVSPLTIDSYAYATDPAANISDVVAAQLRDRLASLLGDSINDSLIVPWRFAPSSYAQCTRPYRAVDSSGALANATRADFDAGRSECMTNMAAFVPLIRDRFGIPEGGISAAYLMAGAESGCYPWSVLPVNQQNESTPRSGLGRTDSGVCAIRLEPSRVNILPEGIQIVLAENGETEPRTISQYRFLSLVAVPQQRMTGAGSGPTLSCDNARPPVSAGRLAATGNLFFDRSLNTCTCGSDATCATHAACVDPRSCLVSPGGTSPATLLDTSCL